MRTSRLLLAGAVALVLSFALASRAGAVVSDFTINSSHVEIIHSDCLSSSGDLLELQVDFTNNDYAVETECDGANALTDGIFVTILDSCGGVGDTASFPAFQSHTVRKGTFGTIEGDLNGGQPADAKLDVITAPTATFCGRWNLKAVVGDLDLSAISTGSTTVGLELEDQDSSITCVDVPAEVLGTDPSSCL